MALKRAKRRRRRLCVCTCDTRCPLSSEESRMPNARGGHQRASKENVSNLGTGEKADNRCWLDASALKCPQLSWLTTPRLQQFWNGGGLISRLNQVKTCSGSRPKPHEPALPASADLQPAFKSVIFLEGIFYGKTLSRPSASLRAKTRCKDLPR